MAQGVGSCVQTTALLKVMIPFPSQAGKLGPEAAPSTSEFTEVLKLDSFQENVADYLFDGAVNTSCFLT